MVRNWSVGSDPFFFDFLESELDCCAGVNASFAISSIWSGERDWVIRLAQSPSHYWISCAPLNMVPRASKILRAMYKEPSFVCSMERSG